MSENSPTTHILADGQHVGEYIVEQFIHDGLLCQTYRVRNANGDACFLKLFDLERAGGRLKADNIREITYTRGLDHPNVVHYLADDIIELDGKAFPYLVCSYFSARLLSEPILAGTKFDFNNAVNIYRQILCGLQYLHGLNLVHNDITPRNVMYSPESGEVRIIDTGHLSRANSREDSYLVYDLTPAYRSPESFRLISSPAGDVFSATAVLFAMLTGHAPWHDVLPADGNKTGVHMARKHSLNVSEIPDLPRWVAHILVGGLDPHTDRRLSIEQILQAIDSKTSPIDEAPAAEPASDKDFSEKFGKQRQCTASSDADADADAEVVTPKGKGFADVAGMDQIKDMLQKRVLFVLKNKERAEKYRLTPPNGMLLYGPPGCGKTYFAEKFAEESGFKYKIIKASDLGSIYVHGGQGKIAELFDKARKQAPIIICFDEFDAMVPNRSSRSAENISGEVNEFLSQLNNCSKHQIFVIGTTNKPESIDPAVLRKGRIDLSVYIPAPDNTARRLMFELYLKDRPCGDINAQELADATANYVASDIAFIVNDAALIAALRDEPISQQMLLECIRSTRPSLNEKLLRDYEDSRKKFEDISGVDQRPRVGFNQN